MRVTVTYRGVPVVTLDAGVARTPSGAVAIGLGAPLGGHAACGADRPAAAAALEHARMLRSSVALRTRQPPLSPKARS